MDIIRNYAHRTYGAVGEVAFTAPDGEYSLNGKPLPDASVRHLLTFALQTLQDAYAGAKSEAEAQGAFHGKLDRLIAGTLGTRGAGAGIDEFTRVARIIMRGQFKAAYAPASAERVSFKALTAEEQDAKLDGWFATNEDAMRPVVEAELAERAKAIADRAKLAGKVSFAM